METATAANTSGIASLDAREPFVVEERNFSATVDGTDDAVVSVEVTAPAAGQVTINSTTNVAEPIAGLAARCSINTATIPPTLDNDYLQGWQSPGTPGGNAQMAGTRVFDIAAGEVATYDLVCDTSGTGGSVDVDDSVLTAIFTPAR